MNKGPTKNDNEVGLQRLVKWGLEWIYDMSIQLMGGVNKLRTGDL